MKKTVNRVSRVVFCLSIFIFAGFLCGCASSNKNSQLSGPYGTLSRPQMKNPFPKQPGSNPDDTDLLKSLPEMTGEDYEASGDISFRSGNYYMAFVQYEKALEHNPDNRRVNYKNGLLFLLSDKPEEAVKEFQTVLKKEPGHALALQGLGEAFFQMKQYVDAEKYFHKALDLEPGLWKARNFLGAIYDFQKKYDLAFREYTEAISLKPTEGLLYNNLGVSLSLAGRYEEAVKAFKKALETGAPKEKTYNNMGMALAKTGRYEAALEAFENGMDSSRANNNLGCLYMAAGEYREAARYFNQAIINSPKFYAKANDNLKKAEVGSVK